MAIDDPVGIQITQTEEEIEAEISPPVRVAKLMISGTLAAALAPMPFVSQIITSLFANSTVRFERRFLKVAEALNEQQRRIENKIPDRSYYESEEFQTLIGLVIERLHTTRDAEKLSMFGTALANCGASDFQADDREDFIRILRDMSVGDLEELRMFAPSPADRVGPQLDENLRFHLRSSWRNSSIESLSRTTRLVGMGLVNETLSMKEYRGSFEFRNAGDARKALADYLKQAPNRSYKLSLLGWRFLQFISKEAVTPMKSV